MCGVDRTHDLGACGESDTLRIARAALHFWEEPCLSGTVGSGTVFFSGCGLGCIFCQNRGIAHAHHGKSVSTERLVEIFFELAEKGAANINLVTPTHFVPHIVSALETAKKQGLALPIVYNSSGYERVETLRMLDGLIDIYLPDYKYRSPSLSARFSHAPDYPSVAEAALDEMHRQTGAPVFDKDGMMRRGLIVRHLVLPGHTDDSMAVLRFLHEKYGDIYISIMNQYTPCGDFPGAPELSRRLTRYEYDKVTGFAESIGIRNGFIQSGGTAAESFIPDFDFSGV